MKIVLNFEVDEEEISLSDEVRKLISKSEMKEILMLEWNDQMNRIDDWSQIYKFIEDKRDKNRKE